MRKKVLLLNLPGKMPYIRDYYCSKVSKGSYIYPPTDLVVLSGIIAEKYDIAVLDAMVHGISESSCMAEIEAIKPDAVIALAGAVSWEEDSHILEEIKKKTNVPIIVTGDLFLEDSAGILKNYPFLDAILLDFTNTDAIAYLEDKEDEIKNMVYRKDGGIKIKALPRTAENEYAIPIPRHELFQGNYNYPFVRHRPFATVLTDYGCPYKCSFCVIATLGFKCRSVENVIAELCYLKKLGYKEIYFNDQTFGIKRTRAQELCESMIKEELNFGWVCWSRVDVIDEKLLKIMKKAGCHTILFGVETANEDTLKNMGKGYTLRGVEETFRLCKKYGVRILATYILGLPGEDREDVLKTIEFAVRLDSDFVSFNTLIPRAGTPIRQHAVNSGWIAEGDIRMDQSGTYTVMGNEALTSDEILALKKNAVRRFYGRPSYIAKRLLGVRSLYEFKRLIMDGKGVFFGEYGG
ncbi:MAG: radical SAM protein [Deltaproteobacteria bacterium]|nr:radical SAM protein [Deltaproteobacteria bacterium]